MSTAKGNTPTTPPLAQYPVPDDEEAARGQFLYQQDTLKAGKWKLSDDDLNFIALQNAYDESGSDPRLYDIHEELKALRKEVTKASEAHSYGGLLFVIVILLGAQSWLLYLLAVKLGAITSW